MPFKLTERIEKLSVLSRDSKVWIVAVYRMYKVEKNGI